MVVRGSLNFLPWRTTSVRFGVVQMPRFPRRPHSHLLQTQLCAGSGKASPPDSTAQQVFFAKEPRCEVFLAAGSLAAMELILQQTDLAEILCFAVRRIAALDAASDWTIKRETSIFFRKAGGT